MFAKSVSNAGSKMTFAFLRRKRPFVQICTSQDTWIRRRAGEVRLHTQKAPGLLAQRGGRIGGCRCGPLPTAFSSTVLLLAQRWGCQESCGSQQDDASVATSLLGTGGETAPALLWVLQFGRQHWASLKLDIFGKK